MFTSRYCHSRWSKRGEERYLYDDKALEEYKKSHAGDFDAAALPSLGEMDADQLWGDDVKLRTAS